MESETPSLVEDEDLVASVAVAVGAGTANDNRGKHRILAELKRLEQELRSLEECCICLSAYDDGAELRELPCHHHFHCTCIDKWLHMNATCPLCKFNFLKPNSQSGREEV